MSPVWHVSVPPQAPGDADPNALTSGTMSNMKEMSGLHHTDIAGAPDALEASEDLRSGKRRAMRFAHLQGVLQRPSLARDNR